MLGEVHHLLSRVPESGLIPVVGHHFRTVTLLLIGQTGGGLSSKSVQDGSHNLYSARFACFSDVCVACRMGAD
jgi:hypothetical protein